LHCFSGFAFEAGHIGICNHIHYRMGLSLADCGLNRVFIGARVEQELPLDRQTGNGTTGHRLYARIDE